MSTGLANDLSAEDDLDLAIGGFARDRFQPGFLRGAGIDPLHERLEPPHQKEKAEDQERPYEEHHQQDELITRHQGQCCRA